MGFPAKAKKEEAMLHLLLLPLLTQRHLILMVVLIKMLTSITSIN